MQQLRSELVAGLRFFTGLLSPWKGVLLYGPPGTGKVAKFQCISDLQYRLVVRPCWPVQWQPSVAPPSSTSQLLLLSANGAVRHSSANPLYNETYSISQETVRSWCVCCLSWRGTTLRPPFSSTKWTQSWVLYSVRKIQAPLCCAGSRDASGEHEGS